MDPTPDNLLALDPGDEVIIHLENGWDISATVADPHHPNLGQEAEREIREEGGGNGQVTVFFDTEGGDRSITAYHEDKHPDRRRDLAKFEVPSIYSHEWREVISIERVEPDDDEGMRCAECGVRHTDWEKKGEGAVDDGHHVGHVTRVKCGRCGAVDEVARP